MGACRGDLDDDVHHLDVLNPAKTHGSKDLRRL